MKIILDIEENISRKVVDAKAATCRDCKKFIQHYRRTECGTYTEVYCGHCTCVRVKSRNPDDKACANFEIADESDRR